MKKETLFKLHSYQICILKEIAVLCEKYNLTYFLIGGTLLGAVRHKGFIPWDDDLDIAMPRKDYERFKAIAHKEFDNKEFYYIDMDDEKYFHPYAKVCKKNTIFQEKLNEKQGIFVDIFPLDYSYKHNNFGQKKCLLKLCNLLSLYNHKSIFKLIPRNIIVKCIKKTMTLKNKKEKVYFINLGSQYSISKQTIKIENYLPVVKLQFEDRYYSAPANYDFILQSIYGADYMKIPPKEKQITHNPIKISFDINEIGK